MPVWEVLGYSAAEVDFDCWNISSTCLLCRFSHSSSNGVNGKLTSEIAGLDVGETVEAVPEGCTPEVFKLLPMV
jgi:hypothetical protein